MNTAKQLVETIKEGIQEKKGSNIVIADLSEIDGTIAKYFIICQGGSPSQVEAIAESVGDFCRKKLGEKPVNVAGLGNDQWVAIDFVDVLVHIFQPEVRQFYDLEHLWEDAKQTTVPDVTPQSCAYIIIYRYSTFANGEVKEFKEVSAVKAICFTTKFTTQKAIGYNF